MASERLAPELRPEPLVIALCFGNEGPICVHSRNRRTGRRASGRRKDTVFAKNRFNCRHRQLPYGQKSNLYSVGGGPRLRTRVSIRCNARRHRFRGSASKPRRKRRCRPLLSTIVGTHIKRSNLPGTYTGMPVCPPRSARTCRLLRAASPLSHRPDRSCGFPRQNVRHWRIRPHRTARLATRPEAHAYNASRTLRPTPLPSGHPA